MSDNVEVRVNLIPAALTALENVSDLTGLNRATVINRALQLYAHIEMERRIAGADLALVNGNRVSLLSMSNDPPEVTERFQRFEAPRELLRARRPWWRRWAS